MIIKGNNRLWIVLAATVLLCTIFSMTICGADADPTVYLDAAHGKDTNSGKTSAEAFATMDAAVNAVADGGQIVLVSDYVIKNHYTEPEHSGEIVITAKDSKQEYAASLSFAVSGETHYRLGGAVVFRDINIDMTNFVMFAAQFHPITFDTGVTVHNGGRYAFVIGGYQTPSGATLPQNLDSHITINSGTFYKVCGFTRTKGAASLDFTGTSHITVNGGNIGEIYGASLYNHYSGSTVMNINGGTVSVLNAGGDVTRRLNGSATITLSGGTVGTVNINNVVGDATLTLSGGKIGAAAHIYASDAIEKLAEKAKSVKTLKCNSMFYDAALVARLRTVFDVYENFAKLYVKAGADGKGLSETDPCGSLKQAFEQLRECGGDIYVIGTCAFDLTENPGKIGAPIRIIGAEQGNISIAANSAFSFEGDIIFDDITLSGAGAVNLRIKDGTLAFGEGFAVSGMTLSLSGEGESSEIQIAGGAFDQIVSGATGGEKHVVTITGGSVRKLVVGGDSAVSAADLSISGGSVDTIEIKDSCVTENLVVRLRGGKIGNVTIGKLQCEVILDLGKAEIGNITITETLPNGVLLCDADADQAWISKLEAKFPGKIDANRIYLADGGTGDGSSAASPVGDLNKAITLLGGSGTVVVCNTYTIENSYSIRTHTGKITLTSYDHISDFREQGACIRLGANLSLGGETVIENLNFQASGAAVIYAKGYALTIGNAVETELTDGNTEYIGLVGGHNTMLTSYTTNLTVNSGNWGAVRGGYNSTKLIAEGIHTTLTINGGVFHKYIAGGSRGNTGGTVDMTITGGTFYGGVFGLYEEDSAGYKLDYDITMRITDGEFYGMIGPAKSQKTVLDGTFSVYLGGGSFGHLTDLRGTEVYSGGMTSTLSISSDLDISAKEEGSLTFTNYLRRGADPWLFYYDGFYYYTETAGTVIQLYKVANISDLKTSAGTGYQILKPTVGKNLWSPEIHYFTAEDVGAENAGWYMFFGYDDGTTANQRQHVVKCLDGDNLLGRWGDPVTGEVNVPRKVNFVDSPSYNRDQLCGGSSAIVINGKKYLTFISELGRGTADFHQTVNIVEFENPWTMVGEPTTICVPEYPWEMGGYGEDTSSPGQWYPKVVEGASAVYGENGEVYLMYTGSGYWTIYYQLGYLKFLGGDPMDAKNWQKNPSPILSLSASINGCGHGSYMTDEFGTRWIAYHAYIGKDTSSKRHIFVEPYYADADGVRIGNGTGHPAPIETEYTIQMNSTPLEKKISGFDAVERSAFRPSRVYEEQFADVTADKWFHSYVKTAYAYALANGTGKTTFSPDSEFTVAQALTAAANVHTVYSGKSVAAAAAGDAWYMPYVKYCVENGIITANLFSDYNRAITRGEMAVVFANILPDGEYAAVRSGNIPDVPATLACHKAVLKLYNAGIVDGDSGTGNYRPDDKLRRSEACVIFTRIAVPSLRVK